MSKEVTNTKRAVLLALLQVALVIALIVAAELSKGDVAFFGIVSMLLILIMFALTITGTYFSIKSFKETNSLRKTIAMMLNFGMLLLFLWAIISNALDVAKSLN